MEINKNAIIDLINKRTAGLHYQDLTKEEFKLFLALFADDLKDIILRLSKHPPIINKNL